MGDPAGAVLDAAALAVSTLDPPRDAGAEHCLEVGSQALQQVLDGARPLFGPDRTSKQPVAGDTERIRGGGRGVCPAGIPLVANRTVARQEFTHWRGTYDASVLALGRLTGAEVAPLAGDRHDQNDPPR